MTLAAANNSWDNTMTRVSSLAVALGFLLIGSSYTLADNAEETSAGEPAMNTMTLPFTSSPAKSS